jgi:hypothetical protein
MYKVNKNKLLMVDRRYAARLRVYPIRECFSEKDRGFGSFSVIRTTVEAGVSFTQMVVPAQKI